MLDFPLSTRFFCFLPQSPSYTRREFKIDDLFKCGLSQREAFDSWHQESCDKICEVSDKYIENVFAFGLAQYLLNLTLKNMLLMEQWDNYLKPIRSYLHVPVDGFVMEAASENLGILMIDKQGQFNLYDINESKSWRQWNYSEYIKFQEDVRNATNCPIYWEFDVRGKGKMH